MTDPQLLGHPLIEGIRRLGDINEAAFEAQEWPRWPRQRDGDRDEIPAIVRYLVMSRDGRRCSLCDSRHRLQLDHITPWSAGGPDTSASDNLRALCWSCNLRRSNFIETYLPRVQRVTAVCDPCLDAHPTDQDIQELHRAFRLLCNACAACIRGDWLTSDDRHNAWCGTCGLTSWTTHPTRLL